MSFIDVAKARLCKGELFLIYNLQWIACAAYREWRCLLYTLMNATQANVIVTEGNNYKQ